MTRVVQDNHLKDGDVLPFTWTLGSLAHLYLRHSQRYTYKRLHECNLNFSECDCDCVWFFFSLCYKTHDGTWDYYISTVFVLTRKGSQYFCLLFGVCETSGYWMFTCVRWFLWFYLYIFDFQPYERTRTATLTLQNRFCDCVWDTHSSWMYLNLVPSS